MRVRASEPALLRRRNLAVRYLRRLCCWVRLADRALLGRMVGRHKVWRLICAEGHQILSAGSLFGLHLLDLGHDLVRLRAWYGRDGARLSSGHYFVLLFTLHLDVRNRGLAVFESETVALLAICIQVLDTGRVRELVGFTRNIDASGVRAGLRVLHCPIAASTNSHPDLRQQQTLTTISASDVWRQSAVFQAGSPRVLSSLKTVLVRANTALGRQIAIPFL